MLDSEGSAWITFWFFTCPSGHQGLIDQNQIEGDATITCNQCDFRGYVMDGVVGEKRSFRRFEYY